MRANVAVCGKFHVLNHVRYLVDKGVIGRILFSHKISSKKNFGIIEEGVNLWLKEYVIQTHGRLLGPKFYEALIPFYSALWSQHALRYWEDCDVFHFLAQGACLPLIERARKSGSVVIAEVVNTHPQHRLTLLNAEAEHWGIKAPRTDLLPREVRLINEISRADAILAPSEVVAASYGANGWSGLSYRIPYGVDTSKFNPLKHVKKTTKNENRVKILSVGEIGLRKGQLRLLRVIKQHGINADLTLVGTVNPLVANLLRNLGFHFTHLPRVESEKMAALFAAHDIYVANSFEEGLALSICEAMAMGLAVVATKESGAEELITHGLDGFLIDAGDDEALAEMLSRLCGSATLRSSVGEFATESTGKLNDWRMYAEKLTAVYEALHARTIT